MYFSVFTKKISRFFGKQIFLISTKKGKSEISSVFQIAASLLHISPDGFFRICHRQWQNVGRTFLSFSLTTPYRSLYSRRRLSNSTATLAGFVFAARRDICIEIVAPVADARFAS